MSATRQGSALVNEARHLTDTFQDAPVTAPTDDRPSQGGATAVQFPRSFSAKSPYDDEMNMKMQLMDENGMTPFGQVYYDDKVGRWLERKQQAAEEANFDSWFGSNFNSNDLPTRQHGQKLYPGYYSSREDEMTKKAQAALKLKMIQLRGPQTKEDLYMLWAIQTGRAQLPADWDRIGPSHEYDPSKDSELFKQGLVRIPKFRSQAERTAGAQQNAANRLWGSQQAASAQRNVFSSGMDTGRNNPLSKAPGTVGMKSYGFLSGLTRAAPAPQAE